MSTARPSRRKTGCRRPRRPSRPRERGATDRGEAVAHRLALVTLGATSVLILLGGLVTNTGAALAVPDWPSTFGYNMLLFPWARMAGGILYEHSHRLAGAGVGLLTLGLAAALWPAGGRLRWLGVTAAVTVVAQGVLGGLRLVLLGLQLLLGVGTFLARFTAIWIPGGQTTLLVLPLAHRLVGSLILGAVVVLALRVSGHPRSAAASRVPAMTLDVMASGERGL